MVQNESFTWKPVEDLGAWEMGFSAGPGVWKPGASTPSQLWSTGILGSPDCQGAWEVTCRCPLKISWGGRALSELDLQFVKLCQHQTTSAKNFDSNKLANASEKVFIQMLSCTGDKACINRKLLTVPTDKPSL